MSKALEFKADLEKKKEEALKASKPEWKTSGEYRPSVYSERGFVQIKAANKQQIMYVYKDMKFHAECAKELQFDGKHIGFTAEERLEDCKTRSAVLRMNETLAEIADMENDLRADILSKKELKDIKIEEMAKRIANL